MNVQADQVEIGRALLDAINARDLSQWETRLAGDYTASYPGMRNGVDREAAKGFNGVFLTGTPDLHFEVQRTIADGNVVVYQWLASGTHTGPLVLPTGSIPPTGKRGAVPGVLITVVKQGKIVREETYWNQVELLSNWESCNRRGRQFVPEGSILVIERPIEPARAYGQNHGLVKLRYYSRTGYFLHFTRLMARYVIEKTCKSGTISQCISREDMCRFYMVCP